MREGGSAYQYVCQLIVLVCVCQCVCVLRKMVYKINELATHTQYKRKKAQKKHVNASPYQKGNGNGNENGMGMGMQGKEAKKKNKKQSKQAKSHVMRIKLRKRQALLPLSPYLSLSLAFPFSPQYCFAGNLAPHPPFTHPLA